MFSFYLAVGYVEDVEALGTRNLSALNSLILPSPLYPHTVRILSNVQILMLKEEARTEESTRKVFNMRMNI